MKYYSTEKNIKKKTLKNILVIWLRYSVTVNKVGHKLKRYLKLGKILLVYNLWTGLIIVSYTFKALANVSFEAHYKYV